MVIFSGHPIIGGDPLDKKQKGAEELRVNPEDRLCPKFDRTSIALFPVAEWGRMGMRVLDDCAEEHIM